jgi:hypothetical protein
VRGAFAVCARYASDSGDLSAGQISVEKEYRWARNTQVFVGYKAGQTLTLRLKDLSRLGELMEELAAGKITRIAGISYSHSAMDSLQRAAEAKALEKARLSAEGLGKGAGGIAGEALIIGNAPAAEFSMGDNLYGNANESKSFGRASVGKLAGGYLVKPDRLVVQAQVFATYELRQDKPKAISKP